ncbi:HBR443Cp [Eremothecium sinecaudum]|uniref:HBR443Cp n=1 Tax=Eremothecium sinecaudum TaxID=45286 RepID=A0A109UXK1_9SACH|nr:HBR443Cp [Eremothecium sinecaudum]AMD19344.1 HBR443Cp [Eremothecium sinecaudum]
MSASFWKFSQDYSTESPLTAILNRAFIKVDSNARVEKTTSKGKKDTGENEADNETGRGKEEQDEEEEGADSSEKHQNEVLSGDEEAVGLNGDLPETESEYKDYKPNLDVLEDLLDDEESYTELLCSNFKLMIFFKYPEVLDRLIDYVTNERLLKETDTSQEVSDVPHVADAQEESESTSIPTDGKVKHKNGENAGDSIDSNQQEDLDANNDNRCTLPQETAEQAESRRARMAAEILSADAWPISSAIIENQELLSKLWSMLDHSAPLSIISSSYFMKINERLLDMVIAAMIRFILNQNNVVDRFLTHIDNPPLMDFLLKIVSTDKPDTPTNIIGLLKQQKLIPKLLDHLSPKYSSSVQSAAGDFLKALVTISANSNNEIASAIGPNELTRELVSPPMVAKLIDIMLEGGTSLSNGVGIVIELIRKNNSDYDFIQVMYTTLKTHPPTDRDPIYLGHLVKCFADNIPKFNRILVETKLPQLETPFGSIEPLGFERFKICELIAELLHCSNMGLLNEPKGEEIVHARDVEREHKLSLDMYGTTDGSVDQEGQESAAQAPSDDEGLSGRIKDLHIAPNSGANSTDESPSSDSQSIVTPLCQMGTEVNSEESSDIELSEQAIREQMVIGDRLKIALHDNRIISTILKMFFDFPWNNFLHNVVFDIVQQIFNGPLKSGYNRFLLADLISTSRITDAIMEGEKKCEDYERETGLRLGYMGHLTLIAEEVAKFAAYVEEMKITFSNSIIMETLNEPKWREYTEVVLAETRGKYSTVLGDFVEDDKREYGKVIDKEEHAQFTNGNDIYHNSYLEHDDENYAEYSEMDGSRYYEYEDESGHTTRIHLNQLDNDDMDDLGASDTVNDSKFRNYMSHELAKDYTAGNFSSDEEDDLEGPEEHDSHWPQDPSASDHTSEKVSATNFMPQVPNESTSLMNQSIFNHRPFELQEHDAADDDYMDPNDDGQSYVKSHHPLYSNMLSNSHSDNLYFKKEDSNGDDSEESDEELIMVDEADAYEDDNGLQQSGSEYALCRTSSKDELKWESKND